MKISRWISVNFLVINAFPERSFPISSNIAIAIGLSVVVTKGLAIFVHPPTMCKKHPFWRKGYNFYSIDSSMKRVFNPPTMCKKTSFLEEGGFAWHNFYSIDISSSYVLGWTFHFFSKCHLRNTLLSTLQPCVKKHPFLGRGIISTVSISVWKECLTRK